MFSTKQSDIFYNDETKEMFVCKVSAISADRCDGTSELVYGAVPLVYKIDKNTNYKSRVYPRDIDSFSLSANSDLFSLTPNCPEGTNFNSITKPLINYNKSTSRYSVTFLGRYSTDTEGLGLNNYIFQDINSYFYLLDANIYIPKAKFTDDQFTFESGHLNSDLYVVGNTVRNDKPSWFNPADVEVERSTDYKIAPMHVQATSSLGFNLALGNTNVAIDSVSGNVAFPFMYSGGFITYNPKYVAYDPEYTIRVDFRARSFSVPSPTAYGSSQSVGQSATRWVQQFTSATSPAHAGPGEGFCVSFFKNPPKNSYVIPNGVGSTLGYAKAGFSSNEVAGTAQATDGLYVHDNWNPNTGPWKIKRDDKGSFLSNINPQGYLGPADSFLGVGFDIGGNFATTTEDKNQWYDGNSTWTATPCSIGIRGSKYHDTKVLTAFAMNTVAASAVPMHTSAANADFVDYRIDLSNKGTKVTLYNKLTSATDYNTITEFRLNKLGGTGAGNNYTPWEGLRSADQIKDKEWPLLNVGLSFTTSDKASRFELHKFEVTGVKVTNPWEVKIEKKTEAAKRIDYLQESSKNLRKKLLNVESDDLVDVEMVVPAKNIIANAINEETNKPQITMCDGSNPEVIEDDVNIKITGIRPEQVDKAIEQVGESGYLPKIPGGVTTIKHVGKDINIDTVIAAEAEAEPSETDFNKGWKHELMCVYNGNPNVGIVQHGIAGAVSTDGMINLGESLYAATWKSAGTNKPDWWKGATNYRVNWWANHIYMVMYKGDSLDKIEYGIIYRAWDVYRTNISGGNPPGHGKQGGESISRERLLTKIKNIDNTKTLEQSIITDWQNSGLDLKTGQIWMIDNFNPSELANQPIPSLEGGFTTGADGSMADAFIGEQEREGEDSARYQLSNPTFVIAPIDGSLKCLAPGDDDGGGGTSTGGNPVIKGIGQAPLIIQ